MDSPQQRNSKKLLSFRNNEVPGKYTDETVNISVVKTAITPSTVEGSTNINVGKYSKTSTHFEPLVEEGEKYLKEIITLPNIDLYAMQTKYYINPHPTESLFSEYSEDELWKNVDYSDEETEDIECACGGSVNLKRARKHEVKKKQENAEPIGSTAKTFPKTLEMQRERAIRDLGEENSKREEIISKLERQMVSLYNLKRHYKKPLEGGLREKTRLPPLAGGDSLTRHRDSLVYRIRRKQLEDESRRKKQIERKMTIVRSILNEQKQKENELKMKIKDAVRPKLNITKQNKINIELTDVLFDEQLKLNESFVKASSSHEIKMSDDFISCDKGIIEDLKINIENDLTEVKLNLVSEPTESPERSLEKSSKTKTDRKKVGKRGGKSSDKRSKQIAKVSEEAPATCEQQQELPVPESQLRDLSQWFENWRETQTDNDQRKYNEFAKLPEEKDILLKPASITFKDVEAGRRDEQILTLTNTGLQALQCRVEGVHSCSGLQASLSGPAKARTGQSWLLRVTLDPLPGVEDGSAEVLMLCCRGEARTRLSVGVQLQTSRAEPTLSTNCVRFAPQMHWCTGPITKYIQISNTGGQGCLMYWTELTDQIYPMDATDPYLKIIQRPITQNDGNFCPDEDFEDADISTRVVRYILDIVYDSVFRTFRIDRVQPLAISPGYQVSLPVKFLPAFSQDRGDVFTRYRFYFEDDKVDHETQDLMICGRIEASPFRLAQDVLNMKLCYTGGSVQQTILVVHSCARHSHHVVARVPRTLATVVSVVPNSTVVAANSSVELTVRLQLGWDFLDKPCRYLDPACGFLMFPVSVRVSDAVGAPPLEATVMATVAPPCPLTLAPSTVDLGVVTTCETVGVELQLRNHWNCAYSYTFVDLPPSVMIEPGCCTGVILPLETVVLQLLFSPRAQDLGVKCGRPGEQGELTFTLKCFTTVSLASPVLKEKLTKERSTEYTTLSVGMRSSSKYVNSLKQSSSNSSPDANKTTGCEIESLQKRSGTVLKELLPHEDIDKDISEELNKREIGGQEIDSQGILNVSKLKQETEDMDIGDLWDFYSNYNFSKSSNDKHLVSKTDLETKHKDDNGDVPSERRSVLSDHGFNDSGEAIEDDNLKSPWNAIKEHSNKPVEHSKRDESASEMNLIRDFVEESQENNVNVGECAISVNENSLEHSGSDRLTFALPSMSQRFTSVTVKVQVVDPLVELSAQTVVLPPTPCTSYTIAHIYLRARSQKPCSTHAKITNFKTRFQFQSPSKELTVEPSQGCLGYKQVLKISLIYSPSLGDNEVYSKALEIKVDTLKWQKMQDMLNKYYEAKENKKPKGKGRNINIRAGKNSDIATVKSKTNKGGNKKGQNKKSKGSVFSVKTKKTKTSGKSFKLNKKSSGPLPDVVIDPAEISLTEEDIRNAKMTMLKYFEPFEKNLTLQCLLETCIGNIDRLETLSCVVKCSTVAPTLFLETPACMNFGPVVVGSSCTMEARIINLSCFDAPVTLSTLNPVGPFTCPANLEHPYWKNGELELPPEHILRVPLRFQPSHCDEVVETFEVFSGSCVLHLQARGRGVLPSFAFQPEQEVFTVSAAAGKKAEISISVSNTCEAPLRFEIILDYVRVGRSLPSLGTDEPGSEATSPKKKKGSKKSNKGKGVFDFPGTSEELDQCLTKEFVTINSAEYAEPVFKLTNTDEDFTIPAGKARQIVVMFAPPIVSKQETNIIKSPRSTNISLKEKKQPKTKSENEENGTIKTKLNKIDGRKKSLKSKKKEPSSASEKTDGVKLKQIYAAKYSISLVNTKVRSWIIIGTNK